MLPGKLICREAGRARSGRTAMITHRFTLDEFEAAYHVFSRPAETGALKVLLTR